MLPTMKSENSISARPHWLRLLALPMILLASFAFAADEDDDDPPAAEAQAILRFAPQAASEPVGKVLASAVANAENNLNLNPATLVVSQAYVDEGPTMKRFRPRAQGRAFRIRKRTSHITVVVESVSPTAAGAKGRTR